MKILNIYKIVGALVCVIVLCLSITLPVLAVELDSIDGGESLPVEPASEPRDEFGEPIEVHHYLYVDGVGVEVTAENNIVKLTGNKTYLITADEPLDCSIEIDGTGTFNLGSNLEVSGITVIQGTFNTGGKSVKADSLYFGEYTATKPVVVSLGNSVINTFSFAVRGSNVTLDAGTSTINTTLLFDDSGKLGRTYYNVVINDKEYVTDVVNYVKRTETRKDIDGKEYTVEVTDEVWSKKTSYVYGFIEGKSRFNKLTINGRTQAYLNSDISVKELVKLTELTSSKPTSAKISVDGKADVVAESVVGK